MKFQMIFLMFFLLLLIGCTQNHTTISYSISGGVFQNPSKYLNQEINIEGYALNVRQVCQASIGKCWGQIVLSPDTEYTLKTSIELADQNGNILGDCENNLTPCHGFVDKQKYYVDGTLIKNPYQHGYEYLLKVSSFRVMKS